MRPEYMGYQELFTAKYKKCKSKKDYKRLCKEMLCQFEAIDGVERKQWLIFSSMIGEDAYTSAMALAIKMYLLEKQGCNVEVLTYE